MGKIENKIYLNAAKFSNIVYQFFGFFPVFVKVKSSMKHSKLSEILIQLWSIIVLTFIFINILIVAQNQEIIFNENSLDKANDILKFSCVTAAVVIFIVESLVNVREFKMIFKKFQKFENELKVYGVKFENYQTRMMKDYARKFILIVFTQTIFETYIISSDFWTDFWLVNSIPSCVCRLRHLQYIYFLHIIRYKVLMLQDELEKIVQNSKLRFLSHDENVYEKTLDRLQSIKNAYGILWDVTFDVNEVFTWSIAANLVHNFVQIGCDSYWAYISLSKNELDMFLSFTIITPAVFLIFLVLYEANEIKVEALKIPVLLHSIKKSKKEVDLYKMVRLKKENSSFFFKF